MENLWSYFKSLLQKAETSSPSQPLIHELLKRSAAEKEDYQYWKQTLVLRRLLDWLKDQFAVYQYDPNHIDEGLDFLSTPSTKGFVIHFNKTRYSQRDVNHFFDYLKEQVLLLGYRTQISDTRSYQRASWVESIDRHYLKPGPTFKIKAPENGQFEQKYGNVMIELERRNDKVYNLRFRATSYKDRLFKEASDFKELMQNIMA